MLIISRLSDEINGEADRVDASMSSVRLFVSAFNSVPCLHPAPGAIDPPPSLTIFDAAINVSKALDDASAPRHSVVAAVATVLSLLGPATIKEHPRAVGGTRGTGDRVPTREDPPSHSYPLSLSNQNLKFS